MAAAILIHIIYLGKLIKRKLILCDTVLIIIAYNIIIKFHAAIIMTMSLSYQREYLQGQTCSENTTQRVNVFFLLFDASTPLLLVVFNFVLYLCDIFCPACAIMWVIFISFTIATLALQTFGACAFSFALISLTSSTMRWGDIATCNSIDVLSYVSVALVTAVNIIICVISTCFVAIYMKYYRPDAAGRTSDSQRPLLTPEQSQTLCTDSHQETKVRQ